MTHASLFSGIGGFDLAAEWMGWENIFHCEWNPFGQKVLKHHFPNSISYEDITKTDFSIHRGTIDILTGGFPCQPYSSAGKRLGKEDERHLWPQMLRTIEEVQPRFVVGENVRGLTNWNGGLVFDEVQFDLETKGYEVIPFLLPACAVNAPHRRDRIWFVAHSNNNGTRSRLGQVQEKNGEISKRNDNAKFSNSSDVIAANSNNSFGQREESNSSGWEDKKPKSHNWNDLRNNIGATNERELITDTSSIRLCEHSSSKQSLVETSRTQHRMDNKDFADSQQFRLEHSEKRGNIDQGKRETQRKGSKFAKQPKTDGWSRFPTKSPICGGNDGIPRELDSITFPKWRNESIKAYGNAIVPQVAYQIFKAIQQYDTNHSQTNG